MFSKIKAFFVTVEHDVGAIIANFTDTVAKLEAAAEAKAKEAAEHFRTSTEYERLSDEAAAAAEKAKEVADKIKALVA
jgi:hypothetical protein